MWWNELPLYSVNTLSSEKEMWKTNLSTTVKGFILMKHVTQFPPFSSWQRKLQFISCFIFLTYPPMLPPPGHEQNSYAPVRV